MMLIAVMGLLSFIISAVLTRQFLSPSSMFHILDIPNERSLHVRPVPRSGGVAVFAGTAAAWTMATVLGLVAPLPIWIVLAVLTIVAVSYLDDRLKVAPATRLVSHFASAGMLLAGGITLRSLELPGLALQWPAWLGIAFSLLYVVWMINLYNFLDGMDGFAGGMATIGFGTFALMGGLAGQTSFLTANVILAASSAGFLLFNFPPARIFLGDLGSTLFGLLAAATSLWGATEGIFPFWAAVLVFSPFIVDATVTLIGRLWSGERVWRAHKDHFYQRLVQLGWGHRKTVLWEYVLMSLCALSALWSLYLGEYQQWALIAGWAVIFLILAGIVSFLKSRR